MDPEQSQDFSQQNNPQGQVDTGINPAWNDYLQYVPEEKHSEVIPVLKKWDQNYNSVQQKYNNWKQWDDAGVTGEEVEFALGLANAINTQPEQVLAALNEWMKAEGRTVEPQNGQQQQQQSYGSSYEYGQGQENGSFDITQHPQFKEMYEGYQTMAQIIAQDREQRLEAEEDARIDKEIDDAMDELQIDELNEHGEQFVYAQMMNGATAKEALQAYSEFVEGIRSAPRRQAPRVLGPGGSIPNQGIDPRKLDQQGTRNLVAQYLQQANAEQG